MIRKVVEILALLAVMNLFALGGLVAYAVSSNAINGDKLRHFVAVMRDEQPLPGDEQDEEDSTSDDSRKLVIPVDPVAKTEMEKEILRREADRIKAELDQRLALNNSILLRVTSERERFRQEQANAAKDRKARTKKTPQRGFQEATSYSGIADPQGSG